MPTILRGILDGPLGFFNDPECGGRFEEWIEDPVPEMIEVWERYAGWTMHIKIGGGGEFLTDSQLQSQDDDSLELFQRIVQVFPRKHGAKDPDKAWCISKAHNMLEHMTDSVRLYGRIQVIMLFGDAC